MNLGYDDWLSRPYQEAAEMADAWEARLESIAASLTDEDRAAAALDGLVEDFPGLAVVESLDDIDNAQNAAERVLALQALGALIYQRATDAIEAEIIRRAETSDD